MADLKKWIKCALIRAAKTFCQTLVALIPMNLAINEINWVSCVLVALTSACVSLLTSTYGLPECKENEIENKGDNENDNRTNY